MTGASWFKVLYSRRTLDTLFSWRDCGKKRPQLRAWVLLLSPHRLFDSRAQHIFGMDKFVVEEYIVLIGSFCNDIITC